MTAVIDAPVESPLRIPIIHNLRDASAVAYIRATVDAAGLTWSADGAIGYARISLDGDGRGLGVERQVEDIIRLARSNGLPLASIVVENDMSASEYAAKPRELWADVYAELASRGAHVLAASTSRLTRDVGEMNDLLKLRRNGAQFTTYEGVRMRPDMTAFEVRTVRDAGNRDAGESDLISERVKRKFEQNAALGTPHGPIAYGWDRHREPSGLVVDTLNQAEADVIRECARRTLDGESIREIARDLNARQVPAPRGGKWSPTNVTRILLRERNAARRVHRGVVVGPAQWEPVYDDATHDAVVAFLRDPARIPPRGARRHLLSGLLTCGKCGGTRMWVVNPGAKTPNVAPAYFCGDCHGIRRVQEWVDVYVVARIIDRLAEPDALDWFTDDAGALDAARASLKALRGRADLLVDMLASGEMTREQFARSNLRLQSEIADAERAVDALRPLPSSVRGLIGHGSVKATRAVWDTMSLDAQRDAIRTLAKITVLPTKRRKFDSSTIRIDWRQK